MVSHLVSEGVVTLITKGLRSCQEDVTNYHYIVGGHGIPSVGLQTSEDDYVNEDWYAG